MTVFWKIQQWNGAGIDREAAVRESFPDFATLCLQTGLKCTSTSSLLQALVCEVRKWLPYGRLAVDQRSKIGKLVGGSPEQDLLRGSATRGEKMKEGTFQSWTTGMSCDAVQIHQVSMVHLFGSQNFPMHFRLYKRERGGEKESPRGHVTLFQIFCLDWARHGSDSGSFQAGIGQPWTLFLSYFSNFWLFQTEPRKRLWR